MKNLIKYILGSLIALPIIIYAVVFLSQPDLVRAKSAFNIVTSNTVRPLATTTTAYITAGLATSTLPLNTNGIDSIGFNVLYQASSTLAGNTLKWRYEYSWDGATWFSDDMELSTNATTTVHVRDFAEHSWQFASSTAASSNQTGNNSIDYKHFTLKDITSPYTRAVFYVPPGSGPAGVYIQAVLKESNTI